LFATAAIDQKEERQVELKISCLPCCSCCLQLATVGQREKNEQRKSQNTNPLKGQGKIGSCTVVGLWQSKQTSQALAAANQ